MQIHDFRTIWLKTQVNSRYLCIFVNKKRINVNTRMNNHCIYICRTRLNQTLYTYCWLCSTSVGQFQHVFFWKSCILMKFEFLSTTVNQGTIIRIENIFIVNKIDKFNVSGFRNTQAHSQRSSQCGERSNQSHMQILDFWTLISRIDSTPLRVDPDPNLPEFCSFLLLAEFYLLTVLIFLFKSSEFGWGVLIKGGFLFLNPL